ncbi:hypothetical protein THAR02_11409 [Trichoderma harzianum]|uniref:Uncharacterized protein n=1 Tax=Trichoderma harzianum TaxID=5544 RepID=A0A0F9WVE7_TRIHA|nr:hypothetical protein THAR02_11409 [Trichoderma harzianum]
MCCFRRKKRSRRPPPQSEQYSPQLSDDQSLSPPSHPQSSESQVPSIATPSPPDLWSQAFLEANEETRKWIQAHRLDSTDLTQPGDQIQELIRLIKSNKLSEQNDEPLKVKIGHQKIIVREYVADAVAFITMVGNAAMTFAPPQASMPWAIAKAILRVSIYIFHIIINSKQHK